MAEADVELVLRDPRAEAVARGRTRVVDVDPLSTRTGGAYIPPARLRQLQDQITDKSSKEYQRIAWNALKKSLNGLINKVNVSNIQNIVLELFHENLVRGRGLLARSVMRAQAASQTFTHVYAALISIINTKLPQAGELVLRRLVIQFRKAFRRNDKAVCLSSCKFVAHLVNQQVAHEILPLEILNLLLERPTNDSVEVAIAFVKECGQYLADVSPRGLHEVFERLRSILHEGSIDKRVQYMVEVLFAIRKDNFKDFPMNYPGLDLVEEADQITHMISLTEELQGEEMLDVFKEDPSYLDNEEKYTQIRAEILGEAGSDEEEEGDDEMGSEDEEEEDEPAPGTTAVTGQRMQITDMTETNVVALRRTIYLTIMSSASYEECAHKLLKMTLKPGQEMELCNMLIECCNQERSYLKFYGLLAQRFCELNPDYQEAFCQTFVEQYATCHRLETNKLRHMAKMFAHLFYTDAMPWTVLETIRLNENDTSSSSRIFIKELLLQMSEFLGVSKMVERFSDQYMAKAFSGLFPKDNPRDTRFAINFFTSIGLGGLTDDLREHWKNAPKMIMAQHQADVQSDRESSSSEDSSSSSSSSSGSSSSSSSSSDSGSESESETKTSAGGRKHSSRALTDARDKIAADSAHGKQKEAASRHDTRTQAPVNAGRDRPRSPQGSPLRRQQDQKRSSSPRRRSPARGVGRAARDSARDTSSSPRRVSDRGSHRPHSPAARDRDRNRSSPPPRGTDRGHSPSRRDASRHRSSPQRSNSRHRSSPARDAGRRSTERDPVRDSSPGRRRQPSPGDQDRRRRRRSPSNESRGDRKRSRHDY